MFLLFIKFARACFVLDQVGMVDNTFEVVIVLHSKSSHRKYMIYFF